MAIREVAIGNAIAYGWKSLKKDFWYFVGMAAIYTVVEVANNRLSNPATAAISNALTAHHAPAVSLLGIAGLAAGVLIQSWINAGYLKLILGYQDGRKRALADIFTQTKYFWRLVGATVLVDAICLLGFALLIIPGIYFAIGFQFTQPLIVDKDMGVIEAMKESLRLTQGVKLPLFLFAILVVFIALAGVIALLVGSLVALPVTWLASVYIYRHLLANA